MSRHIQRKSRKQFHRPSFGPEIALAGRHDAARVASWLPPQLRRGGVRRAVVPVASPPGLVARHDAVRVAKWRPPQLFRGGVRRATVPTPIIVASPPERQWAHVPPPNPSLFKGDVWRHGPHAPTPEVVVPLPIVPAHRRIWSLPNPMLFRGDVWRTGPPPFGVPEPVPTPPCVTTRARVEADCEPHVRGPDPPCCT